MTLLGHRSSALLAISPISNFGTITSALKVNMSDKCLIIVGSLCFSFLTLCVLYYVRAPGVCSPESPQSGTTRLSIQIFPEVLVVCKLVGTLHRCLAPVNWDDYISIESFLQASKASKDQYIRLSGLAVLSKLANASQPLADVRKSRIHVDKIALVIFTDSEDADFPCGDLLLNAQNAGYSVLIYFGKGYCVKATKPRPQEKKLIPFAFATNCAYDPQPDAGDFVDGYHFLKGVNKTIIVNIDREQASDELGHLAAYLGKKVR